MIKFLPRYLRLTILVIATLILALEAGLYYQYLFFAPRRTSLPEVVLPSTQPTPRPATTAPTTATFKLLKTVDQTRIEAAQLSFTSTTQPSVTNQIQVYLLAYQVLGQDGSLQPTTATVYVPVPAESATEYPIFVFGSGTTGLADKCAPSLENLKVDNLGNYENHMITQAAAGFVAVFPDYEGFHAPPTQAYFIVESEAKVLLGALASLKQLQPSTTELKTANFSQVFLAGYSQGGHAALSAAQAWSQLPPEIQLQGIIQYAGAADVLALFKDSPWIASYLVDSFAQYYDLSPAEVLQARWVQELDHNNQLLCVNQAYKYYPHAQDQIYTTTFIDALASRTWPESLKDWETVIMDNTPLSDLPDVPYLSIQGAVDPIVTVATQKQVTQQLCQQGKSVLYREYPGVNHFRIRQESIPESILWMHNVLAGQPPETNCDL